METSRIEVVPHPQLLEALFAFRSKVIGVFRDILGIHEINHIAITKISANHKLLIFSSTPAMEFNLFNSSLWRYDQSYHPTWFNACSQADWQSLYNPERYDELYYLKQIKHGYPLGYSFAANFEGSFYVYSMASKRSCMRTQKLFTQEYDDFYKMGQYCTNQLSHLFQSYEDTPLQTLSEAGKL